MRTGALIMDEPENNPSELDRSELAEAARRVGSIVNKRIDTIVEAAEQQADEIRRTAERDAEETRREAVKSASRVFEQIAALEQPLADLVGTLRVETGAVQREIEGSVDAEAVSIPAGAESLVDNEPPVAKVSAPEPPAPVATPVADIPEAPPEPPAPVPTPVADVPEAPPEPPPPVPTPATEVTEPPPEPAQEPPSIRAEPPPERADHAPAAEEPALADERRETPMPAPWRRKAADEDPLRHLQGDLSEITGEEQTPPPEKEVPTPEPREPVPAPTASRPPAARKEPRMHEPPPFTTSAPDPEKSGKGFFSRLRPGGSKRPFIDTPGHCAVCQKTFEAGDEETLRQSGWRVNDDVGLCPEDQADGWQLPEGARLPFRRGGS